MRELLIVGCGVGLALYVLQGIMGTNIDFVRIIVRTFVRINIAEGLRVATNIDIDKVLIEDAMKVGGHTTKRAVVIEALQEYIQK